MELGLNDRVAIVCGASQGMGRAVAKGLAAEGARLVICSRSEQNLAEAAKEITSETDTDQLITVAADLNDPASAPQIVAAALERWNRVDALVNNTGGPPAGDPLSFTDDEWLGAFEQNFLNVVRMSREVVPHMQRAGWGRIINILALSVRQVEDNLSLSSTTRLAVVAFVKSLSDSVAADGITVNNVLPGSVATDRLHTVSKMQAEFRGVDPDSAIADRVARVPAGRLGRPEEMADLVCFLASERAGFLTALNLPVDGGQLRAII